MLGTSILLESNLDMYGNTINLDISKPYKNLIQIWLF